LANKLTKLSSPGHLLNRILEQPELVSIVQSLDPQVLGKLVRHIGLEDSGEIIALATSEQIKKLFDLDLWRGEKPGKEEKFDVDRFAVWLEIMLEMGAKFAADKLIDMDEDFLTMALSQLILVVNIDELAERMSSGFERSKVENEMLEKALESGLSHEFEEFRIISKDHRAWDSVLSVLIELDHEHHDLLRTILDRCHYISTEYIDDNGGLYNVLTADDQLQDDVAYEREQRREKEGFVSPATAASFLSLIRVSRIDELVAEESYDAVTRSYFKTFSTQRKSELSEDVSEFVGLLKDAGVISTAQNTLLLQDARDGARSWKYPMARAALLAVRDSDPDLYAKCMSELNYLANSLVAGCSYSDRTFRPGEAAEAALATTNLGMEYLLNERFEPESLVRFLSEHHMVKLFRVGWWILFREVSIHTAQAICAKLPNVPISDSWVKQQIEEVITALKSGMAKGSPWSARDALGVLECVFDQSLVHTLKQLLNECPSVTASILDRESPVEDEFISDRSQIEKVHRFLESV